MKPLIELSVPQYDSLLKYASETSPLYERLKNAVKTEGNIIAIPCELDEAEWLREVPKQWRPDAVSRIEKAITTAQLST
jgi:hypothetical protein